MNLAGVVRNNALNFGQKKALLAGDRSLSYTEIWRAIDGIAATLYEAGVRPGDRVGLAMGDHAAHLLAHYSVARLSATILPIDHRWTPTEIKSAAETFSAKIVLTDNELIEGVSSLVIDDASMSANTADLPPIDDKPDHDLLISLSSGTTGKPKGALVSHRNLYERFVSQWAAIGFDSNDCFAVMTPLFFGAGRSFAMCLLAAGGTVRLAPPPLKPDQIIAVLQDQQITATFLPPTLLRRLLPLAGGRSDPLLGNLQYLLVSGEPLHADEALEMRQKLCRNLVGYYASSEGGGISILKPDDIETYSATVGKPTFRTEVQMVDQDDHEVPQNETGRVRYRGPGVATRFVDSEGVESSAGEDGWFYPGDLATRLDTDHIALRGRDKDVIIRGGVNVYPAEIEAALHRHPEVDECAVIAKDSSDRGQIVVACIVSKLQTEELEAYCREHLAPYKIPSQFVKFDELPRSNSGKINKKELQRAVQ